MTPGFDFHISSESCSGFRFVYKKCILQSLLIFLFGDENDELQKMAQKIEAE
jgi:hypothetical protein